MIFIDTLNTHVSSRITQTTVCQTARVFFANGNRLFFRHFQRKSFIALITLIGESNLTRFTIVNGADLAALLPTVWFLVAFLTDWAVLGQVGLVAVRNAGGYAFMAVKIEGIAVVAFCTDVLCLWTFLAVLFVAVHHAWVFFESKAADTWETFASGIAGGTVEGFAVILNATEGVVVKSEHKPSLTLGARLVVFAHLTVLNLAVILTLVIGSNSEAKMAGLASSIDDRLAVGNDGQFTDLFREV